MMTATEARAKTDSHRSCDTPHHSPLASGGLRGVHAVSTNLFVETRRIFQSLNRCPRTTTLVGANESNTIFRFIPVRCKCWSCPHCCKINAWQLEQKLAEGKPTAFITLTCKPSESETPKAAHDRCRPMINRMFAKLRADHGMIEYACILETHKNGFPHWHILARCSFIPHARIKALWEKMTGNAIVAIEKIRHQRSMGKYLVKYCGKEMQQPKLNRLGRVISFSRNFLSPTRTTPPKVKGSWVKYDQPVEEVLPRYSQLISHVEIFDSGEMIGTAEKIISRPLHEVALLQWLNEYRPPLE